MKDNGTIIKNMAMDYLNTRMGKCMMEPSKMDNNQALEWNILKMEISIKEIIKKINSKAKVFNFFICLGLYIWKNGSIYEGQFSKGKRNGHGIWKSSQNSDA